MINVGFIFNSKKEWLGGVHYYINLFRAISHVNERKINPVFFSGTSSSRGIQILFSNYVQFKKSCFFDPFKHSRVPAVNKIQRISKIVGSNALLNHYKIQVLSHSHIDTKKKQKIINWIPDFQHIHFPEIFSKEEVKSRNDVFRRWIDVSDIIVLSSNDAFNDFMQFAPEHVNKGRVLHFVSYIDPEIFTIVSDGSVERKYDITKKYFYLPNQFWKHKNHLAVFEAVRIARKHHHELLIVCSGDLNDYRHPEYRVEIMSYMKQNHLENNIKILGLINYTDLLYLMRNCISIINPSLFEGWSSTVEEAKSIGKNIILSDIHVHREQNPPGSIYFNPLNPDELAELLIKKWNASEGGPDYNLEIEARNNLEKRINEFGTTYQDIVLDLI